MHYKLNYNLFYIPLSALIISSYFLGFYLNEDAAAGGQIDLLDEWSNLHLFKNSELLSALTDLRYQSSRMPLYLIINKFNPFTDNIEKFRISYIFYATSIPILFFIFLKKNFKSTDSVTLVFLSSLLMLSPYFRTMSFWADTEIMAIFFLLLTLVTFTYLLELSYENNKKKYYFFSILVALLSFLSFYSDQRYIFLSMFIYFTLVLKNDFKFFFIYSLIFTIFALPALYLFYIWGGLVPVFSQSRVTLSLHGINIFLSSIGLYLLPMFFVLALEKKIKNLFINLKLFDLAVFLTVSIILFFSLPNSPKFEGAGVIFKFLSLVADKFNANWDLILFVYYVGNLFFLLLILAFFKKNFKNYIFLIIYSVIFIMVSSTYQQYVDPLFFLLIFCYFNFTDEIKILNVKYIMTYFLFYLFMLCGAIFYRSVCSTHFLEAACAIK